ncbi:MAG: bis-aminopropyl spermidine synthase family protein [Promethearchaeota archaeon]
MISPTPQKRTQNRTWLTISIVLLFCMINVSQAMANVISSNNLNVGDSVSYKSKVRLNKGTDWYYGYTETERESRMYEIKEISGDTITWHFTDTYVWSSNEDPSETEYLDQIFYTDAVTNEYLNGSYEGPAENLAYYEFDYFWIHLDPNVNTGESLRILGDNYLVTSVSENIYWQGKFVECFRVDSVANQIHEVNSYEYDIDGHMTYTFSETMWYDVNTGYLVKSEWNADVSTSQGSFHWNEQVTLTESTFTLPMSDYGYYFYSILIGSVLALIAIWWWNLHRRVRRDVQNVMRFLQNEITETEYARPPKLLKRFQNVFSAPFYSYEKVLGDVKILWSPLELPYESLLVEKDTESRLGLKNGQFLVIDPFNRIGLIDLLNQRMVSANIFPIKHQSTYLLLKLALSAQSAEDSEIIEDLLNSAYHADLEIVDIHNRTAQEILLLSSSTRELRKYAKAFGWGRSYRVFYRHLTELDGEDIVQHRLSINSGPNSTKIPPRIPTQIKNIVSSKTSFAPIDSLIAKETSSYWYNVSELSRLKEKYNLWPSIPPSEDYQLVTKLLARRKVFDYTLGQCPLTPASHLKKFYEVMRFQPRRVLLIGDDDLLSISIARKNVRVCVAEIDPYSCALIQGIAEEENLPIDIFQVDLKNPLPNDVPNDFDLFVADPDFTPLSFALFLARGLSKLRIGGHAIINFEGKYYQRLIAHKIFEAFQVELVEFRKGKWTYSSIHHRKRKVVDGVSHYRTGKYSSVNYSYHYEHDIVYGEAPFNSQLYILRKLEQTFNPLPRDKGISVSAKIFYDI